MAVFDLGLFDHFSVIFPFLLVWVITFVLLSSSKKFGENKNLNAIIGLAMAFIFVLSKDAVAVLNFASPWFVIFFIFLMFIILAFKVLGTSDEKIAGMTSTKEGKQVITWLIIISLFIILIAFSNVIGQRLLNEQLDSSGNPVNSSDESGVASSNHEESVVQTLFHPKVLAMVIMLIIAAFTIKQLTMMPE